MDASETSEDFESDDEKNDIDDLEEDKVVNDDELDDSENESQNDEDSDEEHDEYENLEEHDIDNPLLHGGGIGEDDECEDGDDDCLKKFNNSVKKDLISQYHPEMMEHNENEIKLMSTVVRNDEGRIIDNLHRSIPFITKYEKARIIGERTRQLNSDTFMGAGTTLFACINTNRQFKGCELSKEYFDKIIELTVSK